MDQLIQRIRWTMNLALVGSLLLLWALGQEEVDVIGLNRDVLRHAEPIGSAFDGFRTEVPGVYDELMWGNRETPVPEEFLIRSTKVQDVINIQYGLHELLHEYMNEAGLGQVIVAEQELRDTLREIERAFNRSGLDAEATVGQWSDATTARVRIPIIDERVGIQAALGVFSLTLNVLWIYLVSCIRTLRHVPLDAAHVNGADWIFHHSGLIGPGLGIVWAFFPFVVLLGGTIQRGATTPAVQTWGLVMLLAISSALVVREALMARRRFVHACVRGTESTRSPCRAASTIAGSEREDPD